METTMDVARWKFEMDDYIKRKRAYVDFRAILYSLVIGQCMLAMESLAEAHTDYAL